MRLNKSTWAILKLAICFAMLQVLQPFIHGHIDADHVHVDSDHATHITGLHIAYEHEEDGHHADTLSSEHASDHDLSAVPHTSHTILVAAAIKNDVDSPLLADSMAVVLFSLCFAVLLHTASQYFPPLILNRHKFSRRRLPLARAPPQF